MENTAYKNRKKELNDIVNFIFDDNYQIFLYNSCPGYGSTAFISRAQYLIHATPTVQLFNAELSQQEMNPLHAILKNIVSKDGDLYQQLQLFTDEIHGVYQQSLPMTIAKDLTQSDTIAGLLDVKSAIPIYTGFYQDRLKEIFFQLAENINQTKKIVIFIDNIQFMDNEAIYELQALVNLKVKLVCFKTGYGANFDKFYYETKFIYPYKEESFPEPDIDYIKKLSELYHQSISDRDADLVLFKANKNVRKILFYLRGTNLNHNIDTYKQQILKIIYLYDDYLDANTLNIITNFTPYKNIFTLESLNSLLIELEEINFLKSITYIESRKKVYKLTSEYKPSLDIADDFVLTKAILLYYKQVPNLNYQHTIRAWEFAIKMKDQVSAQKFAYKIIEEALKMGYKVDDKIINNAKKINNTKTQILLATLLFCNARYDEAKQMLEPYQSSSPVNRAIKVMYAISLNRCREHAKAQIKINSLIKTSENDDEIAILAAFLISNYIHSNKRDEAVSVYETYDSKISKSRKYPYFLRNAATLFSAQKAYELRNSAKDLFKKYDDLFGYYGTIINMTSYYIRNCPITYAVSQIQMAFEGLQQFNASHIHLAANNLGVCYIYSENCAEAIKYLELAKNIAKSIMPITYATINLSSVYIKYGNYEYAYNSLQNLYKKVITSNLPRLKAKYFLQKALMEYIIGEYSDARYDCLQAKKFSTTSLNSHFNQINDLLLKNINGNIAYSSDRWTDFFSPCYLEYWTINSIDILSDQILTF